MAPRCPACGEALFAEDVYVDDAVARCRGCQAIVDISAQLSAGGDVRARADSARCALRTPRGIAVREIDGPRIAGSHREPTTSAYPTLEIVRGWPRPILPFVVGAFWTALAVGCGVHARHDPDSFVLFLMALFDRAPSRRRRRAGRSRRVTVRAPAAARPFRGYAPHASHAAFTRS